MHPVVLIFLLIVRCQCSQSSCRTNCSSSDEDCWRAALEYRTTDLIEQLFSFTSLSVHLTTFQRHHNDQINDTLKFLEESLDKHLTNESSDARLDIKLLQPTKELLLNSCRTLISTPVQSVDELPPLSCSVSTCSSDILNYTLLFIISITLASLILIICVVQSFQSRRQAMTKIIIQQETHLINSLSTTHASVNH